MAGYFSKLRDFAYRNPTNQEVVNDLLKIVRKTINDDKTIGLDYCRQMKELLWSRLNNRVDIKENYKLIHKVLIIESRYSLDSYLTALEWNRPIKERFWQPRRKILLPVIHDLEDLLINDKLDEYFISQPPRTGKSTLVLFVLSWQVGMSPELANLYVSNSGTLCNAFYQGLKEIITDTTTYCWREIFPDVAFDPNSFLNAKETWLEVGRIKRYHSLTCRSIDASLNGACDCNGLLISDDLVSGIEEALNPERMSSVWQKVDNNMITRAKETAKIMWIGTRWSIKDPIGVRIEMLQNDPKFAGLRFKIRNMPALNDNDESNFDYDYGVGFSTDYYQRRRASFENFGDEASWLAQYQGSPIERSGTIFNPENLTYYDELPKDKDGKTIPPDRIYAVVDVAFNGSDFLSMPVGYQYGDIIYIEDWVFDNGNKSITQPKVLQALLRNQVSSCYFEANNGGEFYADEVKKALTELKAVMNIMSKYAPNTISKNDRIFRCSTDIIANFRFKNTARRNKEYSMAMRQMFSFTILGKNKHEDACDSLAMMSMARAVLFRGSSFEVFKRPF